MFKLAVISGKPKVHHKIVSGKTFSKMEPSRFYILFPLCYSSKLTNIQYGVMLNLFITMKTDSKLTLHHMGKCLLLTYRDNILNLEGYIF